MADVVLSVAIAHAPWGGRGANVERLRVALPNAQVVCDRGDANAWDTAQRAWRAHDVGATHHLVLQDDAVLCDGFEERALLMIAQCPGDVISFFTPHLARKSAVAVAMPLALVDEWLTWCETSTLPRHDDWLIHGWLRATGRPLMRTSPSLVEHGPGPSLMKHDYVAAEHFEQSPSVCITWDRRVMP